MFIARVVEGPQYYKILQKEKIVSAIINLMIIPVFIFGIISNIHPFYFGWIIYLVLLIIIILFRQHTQRKINKLNLLGEHTLKIDNETISIFTISDPDNSVEKIDLKDVDTIFVKKKYRFPSERFKDIINDNFLKFYKNFITIEKSGEKRTIYFIFDSYYMINELKKIISDWKTKGYNVEYVNN